MAKQLKVKTILSSSTAITTDALNSDLTATVSVDNPIVQAGEVTLNITPTAEEILEAGKTMSTYMYIKNMSSTEYISVRTKSASLEFIRLKAGEHAWFTLAPAIGCEVINSATAKTATKVIYGIFDEKA
jgi:hypothetical protein